MEILHLSFFGCLRIGHEQTPTNIRLTHASRGLLAYLVLFRHRTHPREVLADLFWGKKEPERARGSLNTSIWQLRTLLEPSGIRRGTFLISSHSDDIGFNPHSPFWLDVEAFNEGTGELVQSRPAAVSEQDIQRLETAVSLYQGDLLEGFYDDWVLSQREQFRSRYLAAQICLLETYTGRRDYEKGLACGLKILEMDPLREEIHRHVIRIYLETGQRAQAVRQYELCKAALARELQIEPLQETQSLVQDVLWGKQISHDNTRSGKTDELSQALSRFRQAQVNFEQARDNLNLSIRILEELAKTQNLK